MAKSKRKRVPKTVLKLPDLEQSKSAVFIDAVTLVACFQQGIAARIAHHDLRDARFQVEPPS